MTAASHSAQAEARALIGAALDHLAQGRKAEARKALEAARSINRSHSQVHYLLAEVALAEGDRPAALQHLATALGWDRTRPEPFALAGRLLHEAGDSPLGARLLERALQLDRSYGPAQAWLRELRAAPRATASHPHMEVLGRPARLTLCMIVKDEAQHLGRCLIAARRHVDEIVVVDTGSSDATVAIALAHGAQVAHMEWRRDFAAARNFALDQAKGDWVLALDADEVLEAPEGYVRQLLDRLPIPTLTGVTPLVSVVLHNHLKSVISADPWETQLISRLFWREATRYVGAAHETPELAPGCSFELTGVEAQQVEVHHHGYRPELMDGRDKLARNIELLRRRAELQPDDAGVFYLLGRELVFHEEYEAGYEALERYWALWPESMRAYAFRMAYYLQADALGSLGRHEEAIALLDRAIAFDPDYPSYHFQKGEELGALERYQEAIPCYEAALANADYHQRHGVANFNSVVPAHAGTLGRERLARARARMQGLPTETPQAPAHAMIAAALEAMDKGDLAKAEAHLTEAGRLAPSHSQVPYLRAELALRQVDLPAALGWAWASLRLDPRPAEPWALAGHLLHEDGDSALGAMFLEQALARNPALETVRRLLGHTKACPRAWYDHPELAAWLQGQMRGHVPPIVNPKLS